MEGTGDETYGLSGVVEDVEGDAAEEVEAEDEEDGKEEMSLKDGDVLFGYNGCHLPMLDYHDFGL